MEIKVFRNKTRALLVEQCKTASKLYQEARLRSRGVVRLKATLEERLDPVHSGKAYGGQPLVRASTNGLWTPGAGYNETMGPQHTMMSFKYAKALLLCGKQKMQIWPKF